MRYFHPNFSSYLPTLIFLIPVWTNPEVWGNPEGSWTLKLASSIIFIFLVVIVASVEKFWEKKKAEGAGKDQFFTKGELIFWGGLLGLSLWFGPDAWSKTILCSLIILYNSCRFFLFRLNQKAKEGGAKK